MTPRVKILTLEIELGNEIRKFALQNALLHHGKADTKAVLGKILGEHPELRSEIKGILKEVQNIVDEINLKSETDQRAALEELAPELLHKKKEVKHLVLPELPNVDSGKPIVMRFAPGPSGPLHIGHTRAIILNDEYIRRYDGKFIIRFEDTNPQNIEPEAYDMILEDLAWLEVNYHTVYKQSDRFEIYYDWARKLLEQGHAYICVCPVESWRKLKENNQPCPDRELSPEEHLIRWDDMLTRKYDAGEASLVVKTDLHHPNPAVRDFVGFRMLSEPHPVTKDKYYVYPTYNFSVAIDDHLMGMTHILRGKDHLNNTHRQKYIYKYLDWIPPEFHHYGWVSMPDIILKTSTIKEGINSGEYKDWSDIQLGTLQALARRGIHPEAIKKYWLDIGIKDVDITFSWETLYAMNKDIVDPISNRYFFIWDPVELIITDVEKLECQAPLHPDDPTRGNRQMTLQAKRGEQDKTPVIRLYITRSDLEGVTSGTRLRLKDLANIELTKLDLDQVSYARYIGNDLGIIKEGAKIVHWVSAIDNYPTIVYKPDGEILHGYSEKATADALNTVVQFERFGFVNLGDSTAPITGWFTHK